MLLFYLVEKFTVRIGSCFSYRCHTAFCNFKLSSTSITVPSSRVHYVVIVNCRKLNNVMLSDLQSSWEPVNCFKSWLFSRLKILTRVWGVIFCRVKIKDIPGPRSRLRRGERAVGAELTYHYRPWYCGGEWLTSLLTLPVPDTRSSSSLANRCKTF